VSLSRLELGGENAFLNRWSAVCKTCENYNIQILIISACKTNSPLSTNQMILRRVLSFQILPSVGARSWSHFLHFSSNHSLYEGMCKYNCWVRSASTRKFSVLIHPDLAISACLPPTFSQAS
jgi:hypothetical protein